DDPALARVVPSKARSGAHSRRARDVEDHAFLLRLEARHDFLRGAVDRLDVDREDAVELVFGEILERLRQVAHAGVVDEDVEAAETFVHGLDHRLDVGTDGDVGTNAERRGAEPGRRAQRAFAITIDDDDPGALGDELLRDAFAEAGRGASNEGYL